MPFRHPRDRGSPSNDFEIIFHSADQHEKDTLNHIRAKLRVLYYSIFTLLDKRKFWKFLSSDHVLQVFEKSGNT